MNFSYIFEFATFWDSPIIWIYYITFSIILDPDPERIRIFKVNPVLFCCTYLTSSRLMSTSSHVQKKHPNLNIKNPNPLYRMHVCTHLFYFACLTAACPIFLSLNAQKSPNWIETIQTCWILCINFKNIGWLWVWVQNCKSWSHFTC